MKHVRYANETMLRWLAEAVASDAELAFQEMPDIAHRSSSNLHDLLRKATDPVKHGQKVSPYQAVHASSQSANKENVDHQSCNRLVGPRQTTPLKPSTESFAMPTNDSQAPPYPRQRLLGLSLISAVQHCADALDRKYMVRLVFSTWSKMSERSKILSKVAARAIANNDARSIEACLHAWKLTSRESHLETKLSATLGSAAAVERQLKLRYSLLLHQMVLGLPYAARDRIALLRFCLVTWRRLTKEHRSEDRLTAAQKQAEELSFALAAAQVDREGKATQLVKICIVGVRGISGPQMDCVCEVPERPRSRFETGIPIHRPATYSDDQDEQRHCKVVSLAGVTWHVSRELFVAPDEALQFTVIDRSDPDTTNKGPLSARSMAGGNMLGQAMLRGFCLGGFDGEIELLNDKQQKVGVLSIKVAVGVIHFRQPSASLAKDEIAALAAANEVDPVEMQEQQIAYGPQSQRGNASQHQLSVLDHNPHAKECFAQLAVQEKELCGEWAVFYHSYSFAALIYELHAAVAAVLFRFKSQQATLPRLLVHEFGETPDSASLIEKFNKKFATNERDHHQEYRAVGISAMCSLAALGPEASPPVIFTMGYSQQDLEFRGVLERSLASCFVPQVKIKQLAEDIMKLSENHGLDVSQFGGKACASGKPGHLLQIFVRRNLVDQLVYAAHPYGAVDDERHPISKWLNSNSPTNFGQARLVAHPKFFMNQSCVRMYIVSADPAFHQHRESIKSSSLNCLSRYSKNQLSDWPRRRVSTVELHLWFRELST
jgi:hypothetical protein